MKSVYLNLDNFMLYGFMYHIFLRLQQVFPWELSLNFLMYVNTPFITALVKKFLGKEFVPRYTKYPVIFPDYQAGLVVSLTV